jgi:DNA repair protein RadC
MRQVSREQVQVAWLNTENVAFYSENVALGGESRAECPLISIFHTPLRFYSQRILIAHNHPRGDASPSPEDIRW